MDPYHKLAHLSACPPFCLPVYVALVASQLARSILIVTEVIGILSAKFISFVYLDLSLSNSSNKSKIAEKNYQSVSRDQETIK